jgi:hypothetical protein
MEIIRMAFIKRHLMLLSCGLLGLLSLVAIAVGILVGDVSAQMQQADSLLKKLSGMTRDPVNDAFIRQAEEKSQKIVSDAEKAKQTIKRLNARKPLRENVFPSPRVTSDALSFKEDYRKAIEGLLPNVLKAKSPPTTEEIRRMGLLIAKEQAEARAEAIRKGQVAPAAPNVPAQPDFGRTGPSRLGYDRVAPAPGPALGPDAGIQAPVGPAVPTIEELAKYDPDVRMSLVRAHETLCYAVPQALQVRQSLLESRDVPDVEEMWDAQMSLWIQQDVLGALAKANEAAAAKLAKPEDRWVAHMPVKELVAVRTGDYVLGPGAAAAAGATMGGNWVEPMAEPTPPPGDASAVFTGRTSNELYDVIQFAVELVIDARELPTVLDAICGANFYTPVTISCSAATVIPSFRGKVYGPDPVMRVRLEFEGCFFREFYHFVDGKDGKDGKPESRLMPKALSEQIVAGQRTGREKLPGAGISAPMMQRRLLR